MTPLLEINNKISFDSINHLYKDENNKELISTTVLLDFYKNKFDEDGYIVRNVARRDGLQVHEVLKKWEQTKNEGLQRGKSFHKQVEHFIKTGEILDDDYKDVVQKFSKIKFSGQLFSEIPIHSIYGVGGTADLIQLKNNNEVSLFDFKTNKKIDLKSKYKKKLLYPLDKYDECEFNVYSFQLSIYSYMLEEHGYKIKKIILFHIHPETRNIDKYKIPYLKEDVIKLLEHYKALMAW